MPPSVHRRTPCAGVGLAPSGPLSVGSERGRVSIDRSRYSHVPGTFGTNPKRSPSSSVPLSKARRRRGSRVDAIDARPSLIHSTGVPTGTSTSPGPWGQKSAQSTRSPIGIKSPSVVIVNVTDPTSTPEEEVAPAVTMFSPSASGTKNAAAPPERPVSQVNNPTGPSHDKKTPLPDVATQSTMTRLTPTPSESVTDTTRGSARSSPAIPTWPFPECTVNVRIGGATRSSLQPRTATSTVPITPRCTDGLMSALPP
jgi:hypothetical protein